MERRRGSEAMRLRNAGARPGALGPQRPRTNPPGAPLKHPSDGPVLGLVDALTLKGSLT